MSTARERGPAAEDDHGHDDEELDGLVQHWLSWEECAEQLGLSVSRVRGLVKEHQLAAARVSGHGPRIPAALLRGGEIVKGVPGLLTLLHDAGFHDREIIAWLFRDDESLPGRPVDALREGRHSTEVKRRAQAMGF